ncbi:MAG: 23S rRNA (adenine(2503)-C(2))-methyltransferase RlmN, partial [Alphaproteobacteria bacterium]
MKFVTTLIAAASVVAMASAAQAAESYRIGRPDVATAQLSTDGTRKWLIGFADGHEAETVF